MKAFFNSLFMTISMFSILPVPKVDWEKRNMKYMLCFLPLIGILTGIGLSGFHLLAGLLQISDILYAVLLTLLPLIISGGIHMDGFLDTVDALSSHALPEKKREILKDSHAGAFAVLFCAGYLLLYFGLCMECERSVTTIYIMGLCATLARVIGAFASVAFEKNTQQGLLYSFTSSMAKYSKLCLFVWFFLCITLFGCISIYLAVSMLFASLCLLYYMKQMSKIEFEGMSGDLAGYLITLSSLILLIVYIITEKVVYL